MKVLSYKEAADRIVWGRRLKSFALRDDILSSVAHRLHDFAPNSPTNIKHPWKLNERFAMRAWCPLHDGRWARLIVRVDDDGHVTFDCAQGCEQVMIETTIQFRNVTLPEPLGESDATIVNPCDRQVTPTRSSVHTSADGRRLRLVSNRAPEHES
jgi:hypothetical protein